jgi:hypothetical protein
MPDTVDTLVLDLLEWIGPHPRAYAEVLEAWRTSCPRLPVWETAEERGFIDLNLHRKAAPASPFPPPGRSTCASIAELAFELRC